jgi:hypothetical protein
VPQTVGFNAGCYVSFPVLLALTSPIFWYVYRLDIGMARCLMVRLLQ